jgi:DNA gyrase/topoisomerase IV subunit A
LADERIQQLCVCWIQEQSRRYALQTRAMLMSLYQTIFNENCEYVFNKGICKSKIYVKEENYHGVNYNYSFNAYSNKNVKEIIGCTNINRDVSGIIIFTSDGCAKKIETKDIEANNWNAFSEDPIIVSAVPVFSESDKIIIAMKSGKMKIIESNQITTTSSKVGDVSCAEILDETKDYVMFLNRTGSYHLIKTNEIPELGRSAVGVNINLCSEIIYMTQIERNSDDTFITSLQIFTANSKVV